MDRRHICPGADERLRNREGGDDETIAKLSVVPAPSNGSETRDEGGGAKTILPPVTARELETAKVLLTSLALVHAAVRGGIWYGMTELPADQVPFFAKYFRMSDVSRRQRPRDAAVVAGGRSSKEEEDVAAVPLAFDLNTRYSCWRKRWSGGGGRGRRRRR